MEKPFFIVSTKHVVLNWFLTIFLGSILVPVVSFILPPYWENNLNFDSVLAFLVVGLIVSIPSCFLLIGLSVKLNSKKIGRDAYWTQHNLLHAVIAVVSFLILGFVFHIATFGIAVGFTTAGYLIWNTFFILEARKQNLNK